jgi:short subunit dehydrogenase-like uncharacterized protein
MADILLYGATGYTGRLTAAALQERGADFAIAGRSESKLEALAAETGSPAVHVIPEGDLGALVGALDGCKVLITCVGPFIDHGDLALEAALEAKTHYIDSTGEGTFVARVIAQDGRALEQGVVLAPALGFDEVPGAVATAVSAEGLGGAEVDITYALPRNASAGTITSALGILTSPGEWVENGTSREIRAGEEERWSPMPAPLGPRRAVSFPLALARLAPLDVKLRSIRTFVTTGDAERLGMRFGAPLLKLALASPARTLINAAIRKLPEGPTGAQRDGRWTILAEAKGEGEWRNVVVTGKDVYGLTARTLSFAAVIMAADGYEGAGVVSPVGAVPVDAWIEELKSFGVEMDVYAPVQEGDA